MTAKFEQQGEYGCELWEEHVFSLAYLLTFRTYGTWLHGDERTSVKRDGWNRYGHPRYRANPTLERWMSEEMNATPFILTNPMRAVVESSVRDLCDRRAYELKAVNIRTNHAHVVLSAAQKPERIVDALKASATRALRENGLVNAEAKVWSRGRSRRYLWKPRHVVAAIEYTLYGQGDFEIPD
jgi:REP element-mobilizing transposase RayT